MKNWLLLLLMITLHSVVLAQNEDPSAIPLAVAIKPIQNQIQAFKGNGQEHVAYELIVSNFSRDPIRIVSINIQGRKLKNSNLHSEKHKSFARDESEESSDLNGSMMKPEEFNPVNLVDVVDSNPILIHKNQHRLITKQGKLIYNFTIDSQNLPSIYSSISGNKLVPQDPLLQPGESGILFLFLDFPSLDQVPNTLENILQVEKGDNAKTLQNITSNVIMVDKSLPIMIQPPLQGEHWLSVGGPSNSSYHRRAIIVLNGNPQLSQRFAVDFIKLGPNGLFSGDPNDNRSFYSYGQKIFAVSDATIIRAVDGFPDNIPGKFPSNTNLDNVGGNYIIMKLDSGHFAFYAHLIPGSLKVKEGDRVSEGQFLGLLGNSGNSDAPHLHFHVSDYPFPVAGTTQPNALNAQGVPWILHHFIQENYIATGTNPIDPDVPQSIQSLEAFRVKKQILMNNNLADFRK